mmetsp:Transcript_63910/g.171217  ORF Transcript_63910/g.171217 Transcript_63910/m.171217 type:complete len:174 (-) Transcript_63910:30-551(-)
MNSDLNEGGLLEPAFAGSPASPPVPRSARVVTCGIYDYFVHPTRCSGRHIFADRHTPMVALHSSESENPAKRSAPPLEKTSIRSHTSSAASSDLSELLAAANTRLASALQSAAELAGGVPVEGDRTLERDVGRAARAAPSGSGDTFGRLLREEDGKLKLSLARAGNVEKRLNF